MQILTYFWICKYALPKKNVYIYRSKQSGAWKSNKIKHTLSAIAVLSASILAWNLFLLLNVRNSKAQIQCRYRPGHNNMFRVHKVLVLNSIWIKCIWKQKKKSQTFLETFGLWEKKFDGHRHIVFTLGFFMPQEIREKTPRLSRYKMKPCYNRTTLTFNLAWISQNMNNRVINCTIKGYDENYKFKWYDRKKKG